MKITTAQEQEIYDEQEVKGVTRMIVKGDSGMTVVTRHRANQFRLEYITGTMTYFLGR